GILQGYERGTPGILMIPRVVAQTMAGLGWTKQSMREFLWEHTKIPLEQMRRNGSISWMEIDANPVTRASMTLDPWPITSRPENIVLIVAGGSHPTNSHWLQGMGPRVFGRLIRVPESYDRLLAEADRDLGCGAEECRI
ncbi:MAG: hypothetical protein KIT18_00905, partial [Burkholderiales bacterium]|nr:hypothetical protein [Burkholderiales bacterium]